MLMSYILGMFLTVLLSLGGGVFAGLSLKEADLTTYLRVLAVVFLLFGIAFGVAKFKSPGSLLAENGTVNVVFLTSTLTVLGILIGVLLKARGVIGG